MALGDLLADRENDGALGVEAEAVIAHGEPDLAGARLRRDLGVRAREVRGALRDPLLE